MKKKTSARDDAEIGAIVICAVRYALGRESYMPGLVQDFIMRHPEILTENDRQVIIRDIEEADEIRTYTMENGQTLTVDRLGNTKIDRPGWLKLKEWLKGLNNNADGKGTVSC